jgi:hypothetical protein
MGSIRDRRLRGGGLVPSYLTPRPAMGITVSLDLDTY